MSRPQATPAEGSKRGAESRSERKVVTQKRIVQVAKELFARHGFEATSVARIAQGAGVSRSAVFWHFGDKRSLFREICKELMIPLREGLELSLQKVEPRKRLFEIFALYDDFSLRNRSTIESLVRWSFVGPPDLRSALRRELFAHHRVLLQDVEETLAELLPVPDAAPALAAAIVALLDGHLLLGLLDEGSTAAGDRRRAGLEILARALLETEKVD